MRAAPSALPSLRLLRDRLAAWPAASGGVAAVEFALVLPVMCMLLFGMNEATLGVNIDRKLTLVSRALADLTSRTPQMTTAEMSNIFNAAGAVMQPFDDVPVQAVVSSVIVTKTGSGTSATYTGKVDWSCPKNLSSKPSATPQATWDKANLSARAKGSDYPVPSGFGESASFIVAEVLRPYTPTTGYVLTGTFNLRETTPWPVRNVSNVTAPSACP